MDLYIADQNFQIVGIIDAPSSLIWAERYFEIGDFEIYVPATDDYADIQVFDWISGADYEEGEPID